MPSTGFPFPSGSSIGSLLAESAGGQSNSDQTATNMWGSATAGTGSPQTLDQVTLAQGTWFVYGIVCVSNVGIAASALSATAASLTPVATTITNKPTTARWEMACTVVVGSGGQTVYCIGESGAVTIQGLIRAFRVI